MANLGEGRPRPQSMFVFQNGKELAAKKRKKGYGEELVVDAFLKV